MLKSFSWFVQPELIGTAKVRPEICCADFRVNAASIAMQPQKQGTHGWSRGNMKCFRPCGQGHIRSTGLSRNAWDVPRALDRQAVHTTEKNYYTRSGGVHCKEQGGTIYAERTDGIDLELCVKISWICRNAYTSCLDAAKDAGLRSVAWFDGNRWQKSEIRTFQELITKTKSFNQCYVWIALLLKKRPWAMDCLTCFPQIAILTRGSYFKGGAWCHGWIFGCCFGCRFGCCKGGFWCHLDALWAGAVLTAISKPQLTTKTRNKTESTNPKAETKATSWKLQRSYSELL